jgi:type IV secretory pathway VirB10-like protein
VGRQNHLMLPMLAGTPPALQAGKRSDVVDKYFAPQAEKREFLAQAGKAGTTVLPHALREPVSPYEVKAGTLIPAVLLTGISSDLPGQLIAQVREPVYDTVTGQYLLIPQGTRLLGIYDSAVVAGQNRVLVVWTRLIFPNGTSLSLDGMPGVDLAGYAGFKDTVNHHYGKLIGAVALSSLLSLGARLPFGSVDDSRLLPTLGQEYADQVSSNVNRAGQSLVQRQLQQPPTIEIRPGFAVNVFVNADLVLQPYDASGQTPH